MFGKRAKCPGCGAVVTIPAIAAVECCDGAGRCVLRRLHLRKKVARTGSAPGRSTRRRGEKRLSMMIGRGVPPVRLCV